MSTTTTRSAQEPALRAAPVTAPMTEPADAVRLTHLRKSFGDVTAVDGIDLTSQDVAIEIQRGLDKDRWFLVSHIAA